MIADPGATPVTRPVASTVATLVSLLVHVTAGARAGALPSSWGNAVSRTASPTPTLAAGGVTSSTPVPVGGARHAIVRAEVVATSSAARRATPGNLFGQVMLTSYRSLHRLMHDRSPRGPAVIPPPDAKTTRKPRNCRRAVIEVVAWLRHLQRARVPSFQPPNGHGDEPVITQAGQPMPAVRVTVFDASGNQDRTYTGDVTLSIGFNPSGRSLSGGGTITMDLGLGGVVEWDRISIDKPGFGYTLHATSPGLREAFSDPLDITAGPPPSPNGASGLGFFTQPGTPRAGDLIAPVRIGAVGSGGVATAYSGPIWISLG